MRASIIVMTICLAIMMYQVMFWVKPVSEPTCWVWYWDIYYACPETNKAGELDEPQNFSGEYGLPDWEREKFYK